MKKTTYTKADVAMAGCMSWVLCSVFLTVALSLCVSTFTTLTTPLWILALCAVILSWFFTRIPRYILLPSLVAIVISVIVKYGSGH